MKSAEPLFQYSSQPGVYFFAILTLLQCGFLTVAAILADSLLEWLLFVSAQSITLICLWRFYRIKHTSYPAIVYCDGMWGIKSSGDEEVCLIKPLEQSAIFPACLVFVFHDQEGRKRWLLLWADTLGPESFRQLCRQLNQYFFLVRKSRD